MSGTPEESVGTRLRRLRVERGLSQRELAAPGVSYAYISRIEAGTRRPSVKALRKLAPKLGVTTEYLETGSDLRDEELRELRLAEAELEWRLSGDPAGAYDRLVELRTEAEEAGDVVAGLRARVAAGLAAFQSGRNDDAIALLEHAAEQDDVSPTLRPDLFGTLGRAYAKAGRAADATRLFEQCLTTIETETSPDLPGRIRYAASLSFAFADLGDFDRAQLVLRDTLDEVETFLDPYAHVRIHRSLSRLAGHQGRTQDALDHARHATVLLEAIENAARLARAHIACAWSLIEGGRPREAEPYLDAAQRLLGPKPRANDLAALRAQQARLATATGDGTKAVGYAREAVDATDDESPEEQGAGWLALAEALALERDVPAAVEAFRRAADAFERAETPTNQAAAYRAWGRLLRSEGREAEALDALEKAADLAARRPARARAER